MSQTELAIPPDLVAAADQAIAGYVADTLYVESLIAASPALQATRPAVGLVDGHVVVTACGANWQARAWRHAINGRIFPSTCTRGVRRQTVLSSRVEVVIVERPAADQ